MIDKQIQTTLKSLKIFFYSFYVLALVSTTLGVKILKWEIQIDSETATGIAISSFAIIWVLISVPLSLSFFHKYTKKLSSLHMEMSVKILKYKYASILRMAVMGTGLVVGIILFYILQTNAMLLIAGISAIGLIFCKPAEVKLITDLQIGVENEVDKINLEEKNDLK